MTWTAFTSVFYGFTIIDLKSISIHNHRLETLTDVQTLNSQLVRVTEHTGLNAGYWITQLIGTDSRTHSERERGALFAVIRVSVLCVVHQ